MSSIKSILTTAALVISAAASAQFAVWSGGEAQYTMTSGTPGRITMWSGFEVKDASWQNLYTSSSAPDSVTFYVPGSKEEEKGDEGGDTGTTTASMPDDASKVPAAMGMGWNLGNSLDAWTNGTANETSWGNGKATQATFDAIKAAGFKTVRIPVTWLGKVGSAPDYTIDATWLNRVYDVVGYAEKAGLIAIINIHHDGANSEHWLDIKNAATNDTKNTEVKAQLKAMWTQIANKFKEKGSFLIFETMNEIHDGGWGWGANLNDGGKQYKVCNEWQQVCVDAIRATGGNNATRWIGVQGYDTNINLTVNNLTLPTDAANHLLVSVHFYDPYEYTLNNKYNSWGHLYDSTQGDTKESWGDESNVRDNFSKMKTTFVSKGIPVYIGEIGCVHRSSTRAEKFRKYYLEYVCKAAKEYGLSPIFWDNGATGSGPECSGLFSHSTGKAINNGADIAEVMVNAIENTSTSYTLTSVYNKTLNDY